VKTVSGLPDPIVPATFDRERDLGELVALDADLAAVEVALRRLDDGSYGTCEVCRAPIADEVTVDPLARRCAAHAAEGAPDPV
jgi:DnaK suppressor protein